MATAKKDAVKQAEALFDTPKAAAPAEEVMSNYQALLAQRDELEAKIKEVREAEVAGVLEQIRQLVDEYDLHDEVQFTRDRLSKARGVVAPRGPVAAKYRDPKTGETWSGRGRAPSWIKDKDKTKFLID
jgi:DNA-binding protein H-NS